MSGAESPRASVTRVLVVDAQPIVRRGLVDLIQDQPDQVVVAEAASAPETLELLDAGDIDVVVLELSLEGLAGLDLIKQLKARHAELRILVISSLDEKLHAPRALQAGATGFLSKESPVEEILRGLRQVREGKIHVSEEVSELLLRQVAEGGSPGPASPLDKLTDRELQVFRQIGEGLSTREIAGNLNLSVKTVEGYRENIKTKMHFEDSHEMVRSAIEWVLGQA